jgi:hypothetical protein
MPHFVVKKRGREGGWHHTEKSRARLSKANKKPKGVRLEPDRAKTFQTPENASTANFGGYTLDELLNAKLDEKSKTPFRRE